jgi:hypothetical protein
MAQCRCGDITQECTEGCGCGCICETETDRCWFLCSCPGDPPIIHGPDDFIRIVRGGSGLPIRVSGTTKVRFRARGLPLGSLARALDGILVDRVSVPAAKLRSRVSMSMTGTLSDVVGALGLSTLPRRRGPSRRRTAARRARR